MPPSPRKKQEENDAPLPQASAPGSAAATPTEEKSGEVTATTRSREASPETHATEKISCVECRRLKRKCDRIHPCNQCRRYDKVCVFPQPEVPRRGKKYLAEVRGRVERLERLLAKHAPHVVIDRLQEGDSPDGSPTPNMIPPLATPFGPPPTYRSPATERMSDERGRQIASGSGSGAAGPTPPGLDFLPSMGMPSPAVPSRGLQTPVLGPSMSPSSSIGQFDHPSSSSSSFVNLPLHHSRGHSRPRPPAQRLPPGQVHSTADAYERQPRAATGYEWDERKQAADNDGTASLSLEPTGNGYLGFAAGATLLRILQITAGGVDVDRVAPPDPEPAAPKDWAPSHPQKNMFIEAYFAHYHTQYPILHEPTFKAQLAEVIPQPPHVQWVILSNVVLGLGAFCASQPMYMIDYFLERATRVITVDHLETGSLVLVQAFTLLSNLAQKRNKINSGSIYLGIAVRMAIGLGLHRELPLWNIKPFEREVRRRVWWVVFIFDAGASITFGRPILLPDGEADVSGVHNVPDRDFTPSSPSVPPASREMSVYSALIWQSSFCVTTNRIYNRVIGAPPPPFEELIVMDHEIQHWHSTVPEWMTASATPRMFDDTPWLYFSAHKLFWRYSNLRIILARRAFLERALKALPMGPSSPPEGMDLEHTLATICLQCAIDTIYDIHGFFKGRTLGRLDAWYGLHFLFQATFVPLIALHTDITSPDKSTWQEAVRVACETMRFVQGDALADRCLRSIDLLKPTVSEEISHAEVNSSGLLDFFQANPMWNGSAGIDLLPFADLETLMSFWPAASNPQTQ